MIIKNTVTFSTLILKTVFLRYPLNNVDHVISTAGRNRIKFHIPGMHFEWTLQNNYQINF